MTKRDATVCINKLTNAGWPNVAMIRYTSGGWRVYGDGVAFDSREAVEGRIAEQAFLRENKDLI